MHLKSSLHHPSRAQLDKAASSRLVVEMGVGEEVESGREWRRVESDWRWLRVEGVGVVLSNEGRARS